MNPGDIPTVNCFPSCNIENTAGHELKGSGYGSITLNGKSSSIFILQEKNYLRSVWIEVTDQGIELDHAFYRIRQGKNIFNVFIREDSKGLKLVMREPNGPAVFSILHDGKQFTVGISPGFIRHFVDALISDISNIYDNLSKKGSIFREWKN